MDAAKLSKNTVLFAFFLLLMSSTASAQLALSSGGSPVSTLTLTNCLGQGSQTVNLTSSAGSVGFTVSVPSSAYWLSVTPTTGTASSVATPLTFSVSQGGISSQSATITITPTSGAAATLTVIYNGNANCGGGVGGTISVSPSTLNLGSTSTTMTGNLTVTNSTSSQVSYTASTVQSWLTVSNATASGTLAAGASATLVVTASALALGTGVYNGAVSVSAGGTTVTAAVTFTVSGNSGSLIVNGVSTLAVNWSYTTGSTLGPSVYTLQSASGATTYSFAVTTSGGGNWLLANDATSGVNYPIGGGLRLDIDLSSVVQALATGSYQGTVSLTALDGSTATVTVALTVNGGTGSSVTISPSTSYSFSSASGSTVSQSATFTVQASAGTTLSGPTVSTSNGGQWLAINYTILSGSSYESITATVNPSNLADGTYMGSITVPNSAGNASISITLIVGSGGLSGVAPTSLSFSYEVGTGSTFGLVQYIAVSGSSAGTYTASVDQTWINLTGSSGTSPGKIGVYVVNPGGLTAGTYSGHVTVTAAGGSTSVPVSLLVTASGTPVLGIYPQGDAIFSYPNDGNFAQYYTLTTSDSSTPSGTAVASASTPWLTAALAGTGLTVSVNGANYVTGTYSGTVTITANGYPNSPLVMPVVMVVNGGGGNRHSVVRRPDAFGVTSGGPSQSQNLTVLAPSYTTSYTVTAYTSSGGNWLTTNPASGSALTGTQTVTVTATPGNLAAGTYTGTLSFGASGNIQTVNVSMVVGANTNPITVSNTGLVFAYQAGGSAPAAQSVTVNSAQGSAPISVTLSISPSTATWLSANFLGGGFTANTSASFSVGVNPAGLLPNTYSANVVVTPSTGTAVSIPVILVVQAPPTVSASPSA